jgi:hypothetical protein
MASVVVAAWLAGPLATGLSGEPAGVRIAEVGGKLRVEIGGELFAEYHYAGGSRPYLYPILLPGGVAMTRNWPMREAPGEDRDHPHHRSLWWAHGDVNGVDFWSESSKAGKTIQSELVEAKSGPESGIIRTTNKLVGPDGKVIATDERTLRFAARGEHRLLDFTVTVRASEGPVEFGDTKEGTMAIRLAESMRLKPNKDHAGKPTGHIVNSEGVRDGDTWGKRATWVDYHGPVGGETVGVAIFDHPSNPRHPTWWHVRDYGLFAANPFGVHDFEKRPAGTGNLKLAAGESVTFRYRFVFHRGDEQQAGIAHLYAEYAAVAP